MNICLREMNLSEIFIMHFRQKEHGNAGEDDCGNYILEGIYFYSGFMFFYNLGRNQLMPGSVQEIRYINRDENTHLWLFRNILIELKKEQPDLFTEQYIDEYRSRSKRAASRKSSGDIT